METKDGYGGSEAADRLKPFDVEQRTNPEGDRLALTDRSVNLASAFSIGTDECKESDHQFTDGSIDVLAEGLAGKSRSCGTADFYGGAAPGDRDGYFSDGSRHDKNVRPSANHSRRNKGLPWSEEEHKSFLRGLKELGRGNWRGISKEFVRSRTPAQVASHAQKHFIRQSAPPFKKRRNSLFDIPLKESNVETQEKSVAFQPVHPPPSPVSPYEPCMIGCLST
uniref:Uncharacterized protein n=1 Tax=Kalanchoe fedtschenkoi TaxID=63787 RepID=A0A7N0V929_KALFE